MRYFALATLTAFLAALSASASPTRRDSGGCLVDLTYTLQNASGEVLTVGILDHFHDTEPSYVPISSADISLSTINATAYTCSIIPDASKGFDDAFVTAVVEKWPGIYLYSNTATPSTGEDGDFLVTGVSCS